MVKKGIPSPHRTWFQRFLKTDAAFGEIMNGEEYGILGTTVRVLWTEEVPSDWWRYRFWEKIEFLNYRLRYFYFLEVLIWVVCWKIKDIEIGSDIWDVKKWIKTAACRWKHRASCCLRYIQPFKQMECGEKTKLL